MSKVYVVAFVMAGGAGSRLKLLTADQSKPSLRILGHYRLIDFVGTSVGKSNVAALLVAAQFEPRSLIVHVADGAIYGFDMLDRHFEIVHPFVQDLKAQDCVIFEGTADSVRKSINRIDKYPADIVLVLGSDHVYCMGYDDLIAYHQEKNADVTLMVHPVAESKVRQLGLVQVDADGRVTDFVEKPQDQATIEAFRLDAATQARLKIDDPQKIFLASMGNYAFFWERLKRFLTTMPGVDFGKDILPGIRAQNGSLYAYVYEGYWRDVGTIGEFFDCNLDYARGLVPLDLFEHRVRTNERHLPGSQIAQCERLVNVVLSDGVIIQPGCSLEDVVFGYQVIVEKGASLEECILFGADRDVFFQERRVQGYTTRIGPGAHLRKVIVGENVWLPPNINLDPQNGLPAKREQGLIRAGLKPYHELDDGTAEGDFYLDPERNILVLGRMNQADPKEPLLPSGFVG